MFGCALPQRTGGWPLARKFEFMFASIATCTSSSAMSMYWPSPVRSRWVRAVSTAIGRVHAGHQVGDRDARLLRAAARLAVALAGDAHEAADALDDEVVARALRVRAGLAEARHRAIDEIGLDVLERRVVEAVLLQLADLVVLQHHVALRRQFADDPLAFGRSRYRRSPSACCGSPRGSTRLRACRGRPASSGTAGPSGGCRRRIRGVRS